jgi:hypothetical protein
MHLGAGRPRTLGSEGLVHVKQQAGNVEDPAGHPDVLGGYGNPHQLVHAADVGTAVGARVYRDRPGAVAVRRGCPVLAVKLQGHADSAADLSSEPVALHDGGRDEDVTPDQCHRVMIHPPAHP